MARGAIYGYAVQRAPVEDAAFRRLVPSTKLELLPPSACLSTKSLRGCLLGRFETPRVLFLLAALLPVYQTVHANKFFSADKANKELRRGVGDEGMTI